MPRSYREELCKDPDVKSWYRNLARRSKATAEERIRVLGRFCKKAGWTPAGIVEKVREDVRARPDKNGETFEDAFDDFIEGELEKRRAPSYLVNYKKALASWLKHNSLPFFDVRDLHLGDVQATPTLDGEAPPAPAQLRRILHRASPRGAAIIALMGFAGLRPEVLGNFDGTDGLKVGDLEDFEAEGGKVRVVRTPALVRVRKELSKAGHEYVTFLTAEGAGIVQGYLQKRADVGEKLGADSAVIRVTPGYEKKGSRAKGGNFDSPFIVARNVTRDVRQAFGSDFAARPYVLRSYFDTMLLLAESRAGLPRDYRAFWMGHKGDIEATYTLKKTHIPDLVDDMRRAFAEAEPYLATEGAAMLSVKDQLDQERERRTSLEDDFKMLAGIVLKLAEGGKPWVSEEYANRIRRMAAGLHEGEDANGD